MSEPKKELWFTVHSLDGEDLNINLGEVQAFCAKTHIQNARQTDSSVVYALGNSFLVRESLDELKVAMKNAGPMPLDVKPAPAPEVTTRKPAVVTPNPVGSQQKKPGEGTTTTSGLLLDNMKGATQKVAPPAKADGVSEELNKPS